MALFKYVLMGGLVATAACADPVMRRITLTAQPTLARGESTLADRYLQLYTCGLQPLFDNAQYVAWRVVAGTPSVLGRLSPIDSPATFDLGVGVDPMVPAELLVTEEAGRTGYPDAPSTGLRLSGPQGGALTYAPLCASCLGSVTGTAEIKDDQIDVNGMQCPALPRGLVYGVWATWATVAAAAAPMPGMSMAVPATPDGGRVWPDPGHVATVPESPGACAYGRQGDTAGSAPVERLLLGTLDSAGMLHAVAPRDLTTVSEIVLTVESERSAPETMSAVVAMRGRITLPQAGEAGEPHLH
ncbi:MAG: hypothetical protein HY903_07760 [Deltaproteobacteria bacterium]|nr:hypothetical protein [Deltaproteobacteria bacterium]